MKNKKYLKPEIFCNEVFSETDFAATASVSVDWNGGEDGDNGWNGAVGED